MTDMTLVGLRVVYEVAARGSFRAAADALGYPQSAVSRQVAAMEEAAGAPLFERLQRRAPDRRRHGPARPRRAAAGPRRRRSTRAEWPACDMAAAVPDLHGREQRMLGD
jgi:hypothetical protein